MREYEDPPPLYAGGGHWNPYGCESTNFGREALPAPPVAKPRRPGRVKDPDPTQEGYCYLVAVREDSRPKAVEEFGYNPHMSKVVAWLEANVGVWSPDLFSVTFGARRLRGDGRAFVQAHLKCDGSGLSVREFVKLPAYGVRVGADVQHGTDATFVGAGPSTRTLSTSSSGVVIHMPFTVVLKHTAGRASFCPRKSVVIEGVTKYFESAELLEFRATAHVAGGQTATVAIGAGNGTQPTTLEAHLALPQCAVFSGDANGLGVGEFVLPPDHSFGREIKAVAVGNVDPTFYFCLDSADAAVAMVRAVVRLRLSGVGVPTPFSVPAVK
jgi:hypothetical protein